MNAVEKIVALVCAPIIIGSGISIVVTKNEIKKYEKKQKEWDKEHEAIEAYFESIRKAFGKEKSE